MICQMELVENLIAKYTFIEVRICQFTANLPYDLNVFQIGRTLQAQDSVDR